MRGLLSIALTLSLLAPAATTLSLSLLGVSGARAQGFGSPSSTERYFDLEWTTEIRRGHPVVFGSLTNKYADSAANIQLLVEQLDASGRPTAKILGYVNGDVPGGARVYFEVPVPTADAKYRVTIQSYDWRLGWH